MPTLSRRSMILLIALSGTIISICIGLRQSLGIFMLPMNADIAVSAAAFGFSIALSNLVWGLTQPFAGALADKHGPRPVLVGCALIFAGGLLLMLFSASFPGALELAGFLTGVGTAGCGFGVLLGTVSRATPPATRVQTIGLVSAAGSLGTMVIAPLGQWIINDYGWRAGMVAFAVLAASMAVLAIPVRDIKDEASKLVKKQSLSVAVREAIGHRGYLFMTLAFFACGFQLVFLTTHLPSYLQVCGVAPGVAASALGLIGLFNAIGTYIFGLLGARYSQKHLLALIYLLRTLFIVIFLLLPVSAATTLVFASAMGFLWLGVAPLISGIIGRVFGLTYFNTLYGIVFFSHQVGSFFGAWMGGVVFDWTGKYDVAWGALIVIGVTAFTLQWLMDESPPREGARQPAAVPA